MHSKEHADIISSPEKRLSQVSIASSAAAAAAAGAGAGAGAGGAGNSERQDVANTSLPEGQFELPFAMAKDDIHESIKRKMAAVRAQFEKLYTQSRQGE